jgi:hypothetical protein
MYNYHTYCSKPEKSYTGINKADRCTVEICAEKRNIGKFGRDVKMKL